MTTTPSIATQNGTLSAIGDNPCYGSLIRWPGTITGRVYEGWVVIDVDREVILVPREKVISLRFERHKD